MNSLVRVADSRMLYPLSHVFDIALEENGSFSRLLKISKFLDHAFWPRLPATPSGHAFLATSSDLLFESRLKFRVQIFRDESSQHSSMNTSWCAMSTVP